MTTESKKERPTVAGQQRPLDMFFYVGCVGAAKSGALQGSNASTLDQL